MDPLYCLVIALNNKGTDLAQSNPETSLSLFRAALETTALVANSPATCRSQIVDATQEQVDRCFASLDEACPSPLIPTISQQAFIRTVHVGPSLAAAYSQKPSVNVSVAVAIVVFNMGIVYHLQALEESSQDKLVQARILYTTSQDCFAKVGISGIHSCGHAVLDLLHMAIHNNLAQIAHLVSEQEESQRHFQRLTVYASTVLPETFEPETAEILSWHKSVFLSHSSILQSPDIAAAA
jgi:hypothetical protein